MPQQQIASIGNFDFGGGAGPVSGVSAVATVTMTDVGNDGETVTITDDLGTTVIFEFESGGGVGAGNTAVTIGGTANDTADNLRTAIGASALNVVAGGSSPAVTVTAITAEGSEALGNTLFSLSEDSTEATGVDFAGGVSLDLETRPLTFRVKDEQGGKLIFNFENPDGVNDLVVSIQVAVDGSAPKTPTETNGFVATTAAANGSAVTNVTVPRRGNKQATISLRRGVDNWVRLIASGGARGVCQIRGNELLEPVQI